MLLGALGTRTVPYLLYSIATKLATCKHPPGFWTLLWLAQYRGSCTAVLFGPREGDLEGISWRRVSNKPTAGVFTT